MNRRTVILLRAGFVVTGVLTVLLGQILPFLSGRFSLSDQDSGYFFIGQFGGSLAGMLCYSVLIKKVGYQKVLLAGYCLMALGCLGLNIDSWVLCTLSVFCFGTGIGLSIPATNLFSIELDSENAAAALSLVNFFWGVGAILSKPFVDIFASVNSIFIPTIILACLFVIFGILISASKYKEHVVEHADTATAPPISIWTTATAWLIAAFNFIHIGIESSVGGWITTYQDRLLGTGNAGIVSAALMYFLLLLIGRLLAPLIFRHLSDNKVLFGCLIVMTAGTILVLNATSFEMLLAGSATLGLGCSIVFPTNMSRFTKIFGSTATRRATPVFIMGNLGGAFMTWLIGYASTALNSLRSGFFIVLICCALLTLCQILITRSEKVKI